MSLSTTFASPRPRLVTQACIPDQRSAPERPVSLHDEGLRFPARAAERLADSPVVRDLLDERLTLPGAPTMEERRLDCRRAADFVAACSHDRRVFGSVEEAAHALLDQHRSVAAGLALAHAVVALLEPAS